MLAMIVLKDEYLASIKDIDSNAIYMNPKSRMSCRSSHMLKGTATNLRLISVLELQSRHAGPGFLHPDCSRDAMVNLLNFPAIEV